MKREKINYEIFDSSYLPDYEDYVNDCIENEIEPAAENSQAHWNWVDKMNELERDDFFSNLQFSEFNRPCMITGRLGLWNGNPDIVPEMFNSVEEAIKRIINVRFDNYIKVSLQDGYLVVEQSHHDGCNYFEIHLLSAKGMREVERPCYQYERDYAPKKWWFKNIYGYLF